MSAATARTGLVVCGLAILWIGAIGAALYDFKNPEALAWVSAGIPQYAQALTHLPKGAVALPEVLLLLFAGLGTGDAIAGALRITFRGAALRLASALTFGVICWTFAAMILGSFHALTVPALTTLLVLGTAFSIFRIVATRSGWHAGTVAVEGQLNRVVAIVSLVLLAGTLYFALLGALQPEIEYDAKVYHLTAAKRFAQHAGLYDLGRAEGLPGFDFAQYQEYGYAAAYQLFGMPGAKVLSWAGLLVASIAIVGLGAELFGSVAVGLLAALLFAGTPVIAWSATTANTDLGQITPFLLALYGVLRWKESPASRQWLVYAGLLCGFALGVKAVSLASIVVLSLLIVATIARKGIAPAAIALGSFLSAALVTALPSFIRSALMTGDPIFPIAATLLHSPLWSAKADAVMHASSHVYGASTAWSAIAAYPWLLTIRADEYRNLIGPLYLFALPFVTLYALRRNADPLVRTLLAVGIGWTALWCLAGETEIRYAAPVFPVATLTIAALALSNGARTVAGTAAQAIFASILLATTLLNAQPLLAFQRSALLPEVMGVVRYQWNYLYGSEAADDVQLRYAPMLAWMNQHLDARRDRVYSDTLDAAYNLYGDVELIVGAPLPWHGALFDWSLESPSAYDALTSAGADYVLVPASEARRLHNAPIGKHLEQVHRDDSPDPHEDGVLYRLVEHATGPVAPGFYRYLNGTAVYKIAPAGRACVVADVEQMQAFGGFAQVKVVDPSINVLAGVEGTIAQCAGP